MEDTPEVMADLDSKIYEVAFHISTLDGEELAATAFSRIKDYVSTAGGSVIAEGEPRRTALTQEIGRSIQGKNQWHSEGFFGWVKFEASAGSISSLEEAMKKDADVLRYLLIKTVRESGPAPRFLSSDRLDGETIRKKEVIETGKGPVSEEELNKSIEQLVGEAK